MKSNKYKKLAYEWFDIAGNDLGYAKLGMSEDKREDTDCKQLKFTGLEDPKSRISKFVLNLM